MYEEKFMSGGNDGLLITWGMQGGTLKKFSTISLAEKSIKCVDPKVRSLCQHSKNGNILVGTMGGEIISLNQGAADQRSPYFHMRSHYQD
jgi:hypothetical protein